MKSYKECLKEAEAEGKAVGHFNIANLEIFWGVFNSAKSRSLPVIIGVSEGERDFIGLKQAVALVKSLREEFDYPVFLNADHTYSFERAKEAIDVGFDSVIIDGAELSFDDNVELTRKTVQYARSVNPDILVEAELGYIGKSSKVFDDFPEGAAVSEDLLTKVDEAKEFVDKTGVDLLAPAVGSVHGMSSKGINPKLYADRIKEIREKCGVPLVLHGGSGSSVDDLKNAISAGISVVHVSTEIRLSYKKGLQESLKNNPDELAPYRYLKEVIEAVENVVGEKLDIFNKQK